MSPCAAKFPCSSLLHSVILWGHGAAVVVMWCSDSRSVHWGNPEHSVSLNDTPVSTHDKQHTHPCTHISVCQAQPSSRFLLQPPTPSQSCKYISCFFFFCLGKMASMGSMCVFTYRMKKLEEHPLCASRVEISQWYRAKWLRWVTGYTGVMQEM